MAGTRLCKGGGGEWAGDNEQGREKGMMVFEDFLLFAHFRLRARGDDAIAQAANLQFLLFVAIEAKSPGLTCPWSCRINR
eukprot:766803-Hanusia_phi.AAC.3